MGYISLIIGCMFAQKTTELLRRVKRYKSIGYKVLIVNFIEDTRYGTECVASHDNEIEKALCVAKLEDINHLIGDYDVIAIDEGQFFPDLYKYVTEWADRLDIHIVVSGLDGTSERKPFGDILNLIPCAEEVVRLSAFCGICRNGTIGIFSKYLGDKYDAKQADAKQADAKQIGVNYIPVCRKHYN